MIDYLKMKQDLEDSYLKIYYAGCNVALVEIAKIHMASDNELEKIAADRGIDIKKWDIL